MEAEKKPAPTTQAVPSGSDATLGEVRLEGSGGAARPATTAVAASSSRQKGAMAVTRASIPRRTDY